MMVTNNLTKGALKKILDDLPVTDAIVQIVSIKNIQNKQDNMTRYRICLYDGESQHGYSILATQHNHIIESGRLKVGSVIKLSEFAANVLSKEPLKVVIIILNFDLLNDDDSNSDNVQEPGAAVDKAAQDTKPPQQQQQNGHATVTTNVAPEVPKNPPPQPRNGVNSRSAFNFVHQQQQNIQPSQSPKSPPQNDANSRYRFNSVQEMQAQKQHNTAATTTTPAKADAAPMGKFNGFNIVGISSLNPYQNKWAIKVRVTNKTSVRTYQNAKGEGKVFAVELVDQTGEIKASAFNEQCNKFFDLLQIDHIYYISRGSLKTANKQYSTLKNDYEMSFNSDTMIEECNEQDSDVPHVQFNFVKLRDLANKNANDLVDILGVVLGVGETATVVTKSKHVEIKKRDVLVVDDTNHSVVCTLWGTQAEQFEAKNKSVILLKNAKVSDFGGGRSLGVQNSTFLQLNPDMDESHAIKGWFHQAFDAKNVQQLSRNEASSVSSLSLSQTAESLGTPWRTIEAVREERLGMDKADYFNAKVQVLFAKKDIALYQACSTEGCNKKVSDQGDGRFKCEKCDKEMNSFNWRLILNIQIGDHTDTVWTTCFQEQAEFILGISAEELGKLKTSDQQSKYDEVFANAIFKEFTMKIRAKMETFNDEKRVKLSTVSTENIDYKVYNDRLLKKLRALSNE